MLRESSFFRTVVLILDHDEHGALGVVLNRPTDYPVASALPQWASLVSEPDVVYSGGPVSGETAIALAQAHPDRPAPSGWTHVFGDIGIVDLDVITPPLPDVCNVRLFAGYAGWGSGQLEGELAADAWIIVDALAADATGAASLDLWSSVLRRQSGALALLASYPDEPAWN